MICFSLMSSTLVASFSVTHLYVLNFEKSVFLSKLYRTSWAIALLAAASTVKSQKRKALVIGNLLQPVRFQIHLVRRGNISVPTPPVRGPHSPVPRICPDARL